MNFTHIGRFVLLRKLGEGGMGVVYAAYDVELDRKIAIKLLRTREGSISDARTRLTREAQAMARLSHPNVVNIYEVGDFSGQVFVAMEFVLGKTLRAWTRSGEKNAREILAMYIQAGRGLAAAHGVGIVHRDFKPDNVIVGDDNRVRVLDFGLARFEEEPDDRAAGRAPSAPSGAPPADGSALRTPLTEDGVMMGTPAFMAPEQLKGEAATAQSDQFGFCVALYTALYGEHPFEGGTIAEVMLSIVSSEIRPAPAGSSVPPWLRGILLRGMAAEPSARWPSMDHLLAEVERRFSEDPDLDLSASRRQHFITAAALAALSIGLTVGIAVVIGFQEYTPRAAFVVMVVSAVMMLPIFIAARRWAMKPAHRVAGVTFLVCVGASVANRGIGLLLSAPIAHIMTFDLLLMGAVSALAGSLGSMGERWLLITSAVMATGALGGALFQGQAVHFYAAATALSFTLALIALRRRSREMAEQ